MSPGVTQSIQLPAQSIQSGAQCNRFVIPFFGLTTTLGMPSLHSTIPAWPLNNAQIGGLLIFRSRA